MVPSSHGIRELTISVTKIASESAALEAVPIVIVGRIKLSVASAANSGTPTASMPSIARRNAVKRQSGIATNLLANNHLLTDFILYGDSFMIPNRDQLPSQLTDLDQWICWKAVNRNGKTAKLPIMPGGLMAASVSLPATWTSFATARLAAKAFCLSGVGFVFRPSGGIVGIDLDSCIDDAGQLEHWAAKIVEQFQTYTEISPSGRGVKLFGLADIAERGLSMPVAGHLVNGKRPAIEVYGWGRYFAVTGRAVLFPPAGLADIRAPLVALLTFMQQTQQMRSTVPPAGYQRMSDGDKLLSRGRAYLAKVPPAVSGNGGHNVTYAAACGLIRRIGLSRELAFALLCEWNERNQPPWSEKELWHKIDDAAKGQNKAG